MTEAGKTAGIDRIQLVYEPQCAAAFYAYRVKKSMPTRLAVGDVLLVADIGGGTGDFVSYQLVSDTSSGANIRLKFVGTAEGTCLQSQTIC